MCNYFHPVLQYSRAMHLDGFMAQGGNWHMFASSSPSIHLWVEAVLLMQLIIWCIQCTCIVLCMWNRCVERFNFFGFFFAFMLLQSCRCDCARNLSCFKEFSVSESKCVSLFSEMTRAFVCRPKALITSTIPETVELHYVVRSCILYSCIRSHVILYCLTLIVSWSGGLQQNVV